MGGARRGRRSLADKLASGLGEPEAERLSDLEEARRILEVCLTKLEEHPHMWLIDYDIPEARKKTFYANLRELRAGLITAEGSTRSVLRVALRREAEMVRRLVEACGGRANIYLAIET